MKILYAIQGTGNGHVARATEIVPLLKEMADVDVLVSGIQADLELPFKVDYRLYGMSFIFGQNGGVDIAQTVRKSRLFRLISDIRSLPVDKYDLVLNDFEPVSAWACKLKRKKCVGLSHQGAVLHPLAAKPFVKDRLGRFILKHYAPTATRYGFHFKNIDQQIYTPVIRSAIRQAKSEKNGHYVVYLPAYSDDEIIRVLLTVKHVRWEVFSKHTKGDFEHENIRVRKVSLDGFAHSFLMCDGILCTAGFETPAEALFMGKKLCVIPMKNQYEQLCNAAFLASMGVKVLSHLSGCESDIQDWVCQDKFLQVDYPDQTREILEHVLASAK